MCDKVWKDPPKRGVSTVTGMDQSSWGEGRRLGRGFMELDGSQEMSRMSVLFCSALTVALFYYHPSHSHCILPHFHSTVSHSPHYIVVPSLSVLPTVLSSLRPGNLI